MKYIMVQLNDNDWIICQQLGDKHYQRMTRSMILPKATGLIKWLIDGKPYDNVYTEWWRNVAIGEFR